jgi:hypothetical protein
MAGIPQRAACCRIRFHANARLHLCRHDGGNMVNDIRLRPSTNIAAQTHRNIDKVIIMNESPRYTHTPAAVRMSRGYFLAGGMIVLCIGVVMLLLAPKDSLFLTAGLLAGGAISLFLAFCRNDSNTSSDVARDFMNTGD